MLAAAISLLRQQGKAGQGKYLLRPPGDGAKVLSCTCIVALCFTLPREWAPSFSDNPWRDPGRDFPTMRSRTAYLIHEALSSKLIITPHTRTRCTDNDNHGCSPHLLYIDTPLAPPPCCCRCCQRSVDPKVARSSINGLYGALITSFTASTIQTAGQLTLGLHVGSLLKVR